MDGLLHACLVSVSAFHLCHCLLQILRQTSFGNFLSTILKDTGVCIRSGMFLRKLQLLGGGGAGECPHTQRGLQNQGPAGRMLFSCLRLKDGNKKQNQNRNHEATENCDRAGRGDGVPSARLSCSGSETRKRGTEESERSLPDTETFSRNAHQHFKWPKFLNLKSESFKNIFKNQKVHQQMSKI